MVVNSHIVRCIAVLLSLQKKKRLFVHDNKVVIMDIFAVKILKHVKMTVSFYSIDSVKLRRFHMCHKKGPFIAIMTSQRSKIV